MARDNNPQLQSLLRTYLSFQLQPSPSWLGTRWSHWIRKFAAFGCTFLQPNRGCQVGINEPFFFQEASNLLDQVVFLIYEIFCIDHPSVGLHGARLMTHSDRSYLFLNSMSPNYQVSAICWHGNCCSIALHWAWLQSLVYLSSRSNRIAHSFRRDYPLDTRCDLSACNSAVVFSTRNWIGYWSTFYDLAGPFSLA